MSREEVGVATAGVLAAAIAMEDQARGGRPAMPRHVERAAGQLRRDRLAHGPAHDAAAEQVQHHGQVQPAFAGRDIGHVAGPDGVRRGHGEVAREQVGGDRQSMVAVGGAYAKTPLAAAPETVLPHRPLDPALAHANPARLQLPPHARPSTGPARLGVNRADFDQQGCLAQMAAREDLLSPRMVLAISRPAHAQNPALHAHRPKQLVLLDPGVLHRCTFAKYAVAFPKISRSIVTRTSSARRRMFSIRSALSCSLLRPRNWPAFSAFTQLASVCSTMPSAFAAAPPSVQRPPAEPLLACTPTYNAAGSPSPSQSPLRDYNSFAKRDFFRGQAHISADCRAFAEFVFIERDDGQKRDRVDTFYHDSSKSSPTPKYDGESAPHCRWVQVNELYHD